MFDPIHALIHANPKFHELVRKRERLAWVLSFTMLGLYLAFILVIAFKPGLLGTPISAGSTMTWGIPAGIGLILAAFVLTGVYVRRANSEFDRLNSEIMDEAGR
jgi:uncharacterized membrane protein (DUF485 family)